MSILRGDNTIVVRNIMYQKTCHQNKTVVTKYFVQYIYINYDIKIHTCKILIKLYINFEYNAEEELEIQRQQEYSGFGEKITANDNQFGAQQRKPQVQTISPPQESKPTELNDSYEEISTVDIIKTPTPPVEEVEV